MVPFARTNLVLFAALTLAAAPTAAAVAIPPDAEHAKAALEKSPRHGEWVDVKLSDGTKLVTWVVYPETKAKAGVVIVIHEIFGLSDWVRGVADRPGVRQDHGAGPRPLRRRR